MYHLNDKTRLGAGGSRECHAHPRDSSRCIKVAIKPEIARHRMDENLVEWKNFRALERRGMPLQHLAKCYEWVETNRGPGLVCERIRNADGQPSRLLQEEIGNGNITIKAALAMLAEIRRWSIRFSVIVVDSHTTNLMVRYTENASHLVFIDGLGGRKINRNYYLRQYIPWFARNKTRREWHGSEIYPELKKFRETVIIQDLRPAPIRHEVNLPPRRPAA